MSKTKLPNELSDEELLDSIDLDAPNTAYDYHDDVLNFIAFYDLTSGEFKVQFRTLWRLYKSWSQSPLKPRVFALRMSEYVTHDEHSYSINRDALKLSEIAFNSINQKTSDLRKDPKYQRHFEAFIKRFNVETSSTNWVHENDLFKIYKKWRSTLKMSLTNFKKYCEVYFESKRLSQNSERWYGVTYDKEEETQ